MALVVGNKSSVKGKRPVIKPKPGSASSAATGYVPRLPAAPLAPSRFGSPATGGGGSWGGGAPKAVAAPKPAPKPVSRPSLTGRGHVHAPVGAPIVAGGGRSPASGAQVTGGGASPAVSPAIKQQQVSNKNSVRSMQSFIDQAKASIGAQDLPALNELQRQLDSINEVYGKQKGETTERGKRMESDLAELFGRLGNFTQNIQTQTDQQLQGLRGQTGETYAALQGQLSNTFGAAKSGTEAELARMGMSGQAPNATADITRDSAYLQGLAGADSAYNQNAFSLQQGGFDQLMGLTRANGATEGAMRIGQAKRDTEQTLSDLMFELNQGTRSVSGKRGDIIATQGQRTNELARALEEQDYSRRVSEEDRQLANQIALERLGMEKESFALSMSPGAMEPSLYDTLRTTKLQMEVEGEIAAIEQAKKDEEFRRKFAELWPNAPGKR